MELKKMVFDACLSALDAKIDELNIAFAGMTEDEGNESKSSAGDKHETSREMLRQEQEKLGRNITEFVHQREVLLRLDIKATSPICRAGSFIKTDRGHVFLGIPLGKLAVDGVDVIIVSPQSPLGKALLGLRKDEKATVNNISYKIESIQ